MNSLNLSRRADRLARKNPLYLRPLRMQEHFIAKMEKCGIADGIFISLDLFLKMKVFFNFIGIYAGHFNLKAIVRSCFAILSYNLTRKLKPLRSIRIPIFIAESAS